MDEVIIDLAISGEGHHELRYPKWESVTFVHLPEMVDLTVSLGHFLHVFALYGAWDIGHYEEATLDLEQVRVPEGLLLVRQRQEQVLRDYVLNTYKPGILLVAVIDKTLPHLLVLVPAKVVCLHLPGHVVRVKVKPTKPHACISLLFKSRTSNL